MPDENKPAASIITRVANFLNQQPAHCSPQMLHELWAEAVRLEDALATQATPPAEPKPVKLEEVAFQLKEWIKAAGHGERAKQAACTMVDSLLSASADIREAHSKLPPAYQAMCGLVEGVEAFVKDHMPKTKFPAARELKSRHSEGQRITGDLVEAAVAELAAWAIACERSNIEPKEDHG